MQSRSKVSFGSQSGFSLTETLLAVSVLAILSLGIGALGKAFFVGQTEDAIRIQGDTTTQNLFRILERAAERRAPGEIATPGSTGLGTYTAQLQDCAGPSCRFLQLCQGDDFLASNYGRNEFRRKAINVWVSCAAAEPNYAAIPFDSHCGKACSIGEKPMLNIGEDDCGVANGKAQKIIPGNLGSHVRVVAMDACFVLRGNSVLLHASAFLPKGPTIRRQDYATVLPLVSDLGANITRLVDAEK